MEINQLFSINASPTMQTNVALTCEDGLVNYFGPQVNIKPTLFTINKEDATTSFITIATQDATKNCNQLIARRIEDGNYVFIQSCTFQANDITIFRYDGNSLVILTPEGESLFLALNETKALCSSPYLVFAEEETNNIIKISNVTFTTYKEPTIIPVPTIPTNKGLGAGYIILIILFVLAFFVLIFYLFWRASPNRVFSKTKDGYWSKSGAYFPNKIND